MSLFPCPAAINAFDIPTRVPISRRQVAALDVPLLDEKEESLPLRDEAIEAETASLGSDTSDAG